MEPLDYKEALVEMDDEIKEKRTMSTGDALKSYLDGALIAIAKTRDLLMLAEEAYKRSKNAKTRGEEDKARAEGTEYLTQAEKILLGE